ncbi:MAG: NADH-ubiquinone oxidoreductase-F iron-sulfur binding region domain-containing protein [Dehalococcoidia bacterium]|nr:NADH-ubiquinone oxidoreductase-F iron-sulfur binding region domain-containing protein [Dehalococcoidia bacterium]
MSDKQVNYTVNICEGTGCVAGKSEKIHKALEEQLKQQGLDSQVKIKRTGCHGFCQRGPIVDIDPEGYFYTEVSVEDVPEIISSHIRNGKPIERLFYRDPITGTPLAHSKDVAFYNRQTRLILRRCGHIDPENIDDYLQTEGYAALKKALKEMTPALVLEEMKKSGLRGRGGAGFPTGQKWEFCRSSPGPVKYVICNADEGDPGAFMDRSILEADPHALIEGLALAGYTIGASEGYVYVRAEYPLAVKRLMIALKQAEERGFLGDNILGTNFNFRIHVREGAGAFVCGEETSLMASLEGRRGMPRPRPPFPAVKGLFGKPSNINNVKTLVSAPIVIAKGADWYAQFGPEKSRGTLVFALTGKIANSGLVEVPLGTTLQEIIYEIGGGIPDGKRLKAVQSGGPSGGCLPANLMNITVDYESMAQAGAIIGSGGLVVVDEDTCIVDLARFFVSFTTAESCGKCVPCRIGMKQMLRMLENITRGNASLSDIERLGKMAQMIKDTSLCGLGQTAPNPILTSIRYFRSEYEEHIKNKYCDAAVCKGIVKAPCNHRCPAGVEAFRYVRLCGQGKFAEALAVNRERIPFPATLGRVCFHACELRCTRGKLEQSIAIRNLKRLAAAHDSGEWRSRSKKLPSTGKRVAIVGSGPAGLTAAYYLAKQGHSATVFESLPEPGGMMRVGIPIYRLPRNILDQEIDEIKKVGVEIRCNTRVDTTEELFKQGYNAVFLAVGAHKGTKIGVEGQDSPGVLEAVTLLRDVSLGKEVKIGQKVGVIGGGNAAVDAARTALRIGAKDVNIIYRRDKTGMPASPEEIEAAEHEGVKIHFLVNPTKMSQQNGKVKVELLRHKLGAVDASGRRRPDAIKGSEFTMEFDTVIQAIGQIPDVPASFNLTVTKGSALEVNADTLATSKPGVYAGGDCVIGASTVVECIAQGRLAASSIDKYLGGNGDISEILVDPQEGSKAMFTVEEGEKLRPEMPEVPMPDRLKGFVEVELGYKVDKAEEEARRCLNCDLAEH